MSDTSIGERFRELRRDSRLTQAKMAEELGVTTGFVSQIESGKKPSETVLRLAACRFHVRLEWLEKGEGEKLDKNLPYLRSLVADSIRAVDELGADLTPQKKIEVVLWCYERFALEGEIDRQALMDTIKLIG